MRLGIIGGMDDSPADEKFAKYAEIVGGCYGSGEYAIDESELMKITPDITNKILVAGGASICYGGAGQDKIVDLGPQTASTVEAELRDLFRSLSFRKNMKRDQLVRPKEKKAQKAQKAQKVQKNKKRGGIMYPDGTKMSDVCNGKGEIAEDMQSTSLRSGGTDDYLIAKEIEEHGGIMYPDETKMSDESSSKSSSSDDESSSESSSSENSDDESGNEKPNEHDADNKESIVANPNDNVIGSAQKRNDADAAAAESAESVFSMNVGFADTDMDIMESVEHAPTVGPAPSTNDTSGDNIADNIVITTNDSVFDAIDNTADVEFDIRSVIVN